MAKPDLVLQPCIQPHDESKITVKANAQKATFDNKDKARIKVVDVDCWLRNSESLKADYIVSKPGVVDIIVELKGQNIDHAEKQILSTLALWKKAPAFSSKFGGLIVFTRCPQHSATNSDRKVRLLEKHALWLEMDKNNQTEYSFETFLVKKK